MVFNVDPNVGSEPSNFNKVHQCIVDAVTDGNGKSLTIRHIMNRMGFKSPAPVVAIIRHLEDKGKLQRAA